MKLLCGIMIFFTLLLASATPGAAAPHRYKEKVYQGAWCAGHDGLTEVVLPDSTRVDCVTAEYAVEADFAPKWAEAIGQALYYSMRTGRKPGILLIMESDGDTRYLERLEAVTRNLGIAVWTITPDDVGGGER
jgi:hypothetical protein